MKVTATNPEAAEKHVRRWHADCICRGTLSCQIKQSNEKSAVSAGKAA